MPLAIKSTEGARIRIGTDLWLIVKEIGNGKVKLIFDGPRDLEVKREEILPDGEKYGMKWCGVCEGAGTKKYIGTVASYTCPFCKGAKAVPAIADSNSCCGAK